jgi:hypothetical protein
MYAAPPATQPSANATTGQKNFTKRALTAGVARRLKAAA